MNTQLNDAQLDERLAGLTREVVPENDLWPAIENQLVVKRRNFRPLMAVAASFMLVVCATWFLSQSNIETQSDSFEISAQAYLVPELDAFRQWQLEGSGLLPAGFSTADISPDLLAGLHENQTVIDALQMALQDDQVAAQQGVFLLDQLASAQRRQLRLMRRSIREIELIAVSTEPLV